MKKLATFLFLLTSLSGLAQLRAYPGKPAGTWYSNGFYDYYYSWTAYNAESATVRHPLIISLHGDGQFGDGNSQLSNLLGDGLPAYLNSTGFTSGLTIGGVAPIVVAPQWTGSSINTVDIDYLINYCKVHYRIDYTRIYIVGYSSGAYQTMHWAATSSTDFGTTRAAQVAGVVVAAIAGPAGAGEPAAIAATNLPVQVYQDNGDPTVTYPGNSDGWVSDINGFSPTPAARITVFTNSTHAFAWTNTYPTTYSENFGGVTGNIYAWMGQYSRSSLGVYPSYKQLEAEDATNSGGGSENCHDLFGGYDLGLSPSNYLEWTYTAPSTGTYTFSFRYAGADGALTGLNLAEGAGSSIVTATASQTTGWQTWATVTTTATLSAGAHTLRFKPVGGNANLNFLQVTPPGGVAAPTVTASGSPTTMTLPTNSTTLTATPTWASTHSGTVAWTKTSGPATYTITSPTATSTTVTGLVQGTYVFTVTATQDDTQTATATASVTVNAAVSGGHTIRNFLILKN